MSDAVASGAAQHASASPARRRGRPARLSAESISPRLRSRSWTATRPDALTMRCRLAGELGVEAMSLYRHVPSRAALLDGLAARLTAEIEGRDSALEWPDALRAFAGDLRALAQRHPAAFSLVSMRVLNTAQTLAPVEHVLASLRRGGFTPARAIAAYRLLTAYARGYALSEIAGFAVEAPAELAFPAIRSLGRRLAEASRARSPSGPGVETITIAEVARRARRLQ